jgi:gamma-glutamylcyclotransferase (GGCT)/AIG2-like uncharacterized protein YtfP
MGSVQSVFTYGSLMFQPVWSRVVQGKYPSALAVLSGHTRHAVVGEQYPGVIVGPGQVAGRVYFDVSQADQARLDAFEGEDYCRESASILCGGRALTAGFYLYRHASRLTVQDWDPQWFEREGMALFIAGYCAGKGV